MVSCQFVLYGELNSGQGRVKVRRRPGNQPSSRKLVHGSAFVAVSLTDHLLQRVSDSNDLERQILTDKFRCVCSTLHKLHFFWGAVVAAGKFNRAIWFPSGVQA